MDSRVIEKHAFIPLALYDEHSQIRPNAVSIGNSKVITYAESEKSSMRALAESTGFEIKEDQTVDAVIAAIELGIDAIYVTSTKQAREIAYHFGGVDE
jgi:hypothetical protein